MRAFIALTLPDVALDALEVVQRALPAGRLAARETLHLTLAFAGEHPDEKIEALHEELASVRAPAFDVALQGLGTFGGRRPAVLYAGVKANGALMALHGKVLRAMRAAGLEIPRERYRPHVTLARIRAPLAVAVETRLARFLAEHADFAPRPFRAHGFTLFRSHLRPDGAWHEALEVYPLTHVTHG